MISVFRREDKKDDCPWGTARLKFDRVAISEVSKVDAHVFYLSVKDSSMLSRGEIAYGRCGRVWRRLFDGGVARVHSSTKHDQHAQHASVPR
jgi:hypothetical protein